MNSFHGPYPSFDEALKASGGYENPALVAHLLDGAKARKFSHSIGQGEMRLLANWAIIIACFPATEIRVLDFGGGFGGHFATLSDYLPEISLKWDVIETQTMAMVARDNFHDEKLRFIHL